MKILRAVLDQFAGHHILYFGGGVLMGLYLAGVRDMLVYGLNNWALIVTVAYMTTFLLDLVLGLVNSGNQTQLE